MYQINQSELAQKKFDFVTIVKIDFWMNNLSHRFFIDLLHKVSPEMGNEPISIHLPSADIGSLSLLEKAILSSIVRLYDCPKVFEFGTFQGSTSALFAKNNPKSIVTTIDLGPEDVDCGLDPNSLDTSQGDQNDDYLRIIQLSKEPKYFLNLNQEELSRIKYSHKNSLKLEASAHSKSYDLIFIDGGHSFELIKNDTLKAFQMVKDDGIIVWHDYKSQIHSDVSLFLDELFATKDLYHIQHTSMVVYCSGTIAGESLKNI